MQLSELIVSLQALQAKVGDCPVVFNETGGHLKEIVTAEIEEAKPRVDLQKELPGHYGDSYFLSSRLARGGYGGRGAFMEPTQTMLVRAPGRKVVLLSCHER